MSQGQSAYIDRGASALYVCFAWEPPFCVTAGLWVVFDMDAWRILGTCIAPHSALPLPKIQISNILLFDSFVELIGSSYWCIGCHLCTKPSIPVPSSAQITGLRHGMAGLLGSVGLLVAFRPRVWATWWQLTGGLKVWMDQNCGSSWNSME